MTDFSLIFLIAAVVALLVFGLGDIHRFSWRRTWAIGSVSFRESIRRRVLWIIPLAIAGVVIVAQLQKAIDEEDAIRQTTKFCLFAAGLLVTMTSIILAATSLPKEIETRVIYTVVTKPTTRLEVILGKILGFSRVSLVILLIMGLFTFGYLSFLSWRKGQQVVTRLQSDPDLSEVQRGVLEHYQKAGLLTARAYRMGDDLQIMSRLPEPGEKTRSIYGLGEEEFLFPFTNDRDRLFVDESGNVDGGNGVGKYGMIVGVRVKYHAFAKQSSSVPVLLNVDLLDANQYSLVMASQMANPQQPANKVAHADFLEMPSDNAVDGPQGSAGAKIVYAYVPPSYAGLLFQQPRFYVHITGSNGREAQNAEFYADGNSVFVAVAPAFPDGQASPDLPAGADLKLPEGGKILADLGRKIDGGEPAPPIVHGRGDTHGGEELKGGDPAANRRLPVAVLAYHDAGIQSTRPAIPIELRCAVTRGGDVSQEAENQAVDVTVWFRKAGNDKLSQPIHLKVENNQAAYGEAPAADISDGDFQAVIRCDAPSVVLGLKPYSLMLVTDQEPFAWNLTKSLFILWLMTVLVISLAVLSSTFLSWPIAVVLTIVLLLGHWCVAQVADVTDNTLGRSIATDMGMTDPSRVEVVVTSVDTLTSSLQNVGRVLPDIDQFASIENIEQGMIVTSQQVVDGLAVLGGFGVPVAVLAYLIMKKKEVAP
jgi:hypothetical protein